MEPDITMTNRNDPVHEERMDDLIRDVFGFSFAPWFQQGLWDDRYESYSIKLDGRMEANLCIFKTDLMVSGKLMHAHQVGAVAVRPTSRGRGHARRLFEAVLKRYPDTPAFLNANASVLDFYPRLGFRKVSTHRPVLATGPCDRRWSERRQSGKGRSTGQRPLESSIEKKPVFQRPGQSQYPAG